MDQASSFFQELCAALETIETQVNGVDVDVDCYTDFDVHQTRASRKNQQRCSKTVRPSADPLEKRSVLRRSFHLISVIGFLMILQSVWKSIFSVGEHAITLVTTPNVTCVNLSALCGGICIIASIIDMALMVPTADGEYYRLSESTPQRVLGHLVNWSSTLLQITAAIVSVQFTSSLVQGLALLKNPESSIELLWQTALFIITFIIACSASNRFSSRIISLTNGLSMIVLAAGFAISLATLWATSDHASISRALTSFEDSTNWVNISLALLIVIATPLWYLPSEEPGAHTPEVTKNTSRTSPSNTLRTSICHVITGFILLVTLAISLDSNPLTIYHQLTPSTYPGTPIVQSISNLTHSIAATILFTTVLTFSSLLGTTTLIATSSQRIWAFSSKTMILGPFSTQRTRNDPGRSLHLSSIFAILLTALYIAFDSSSSDPLIIKT